MNQWERWFPIVAQTRDYRGPGRPIAGDLRMTFPQVARTLVASNRTARVREQLLLRVILAWRLAANDGLVPHPGMIPNNCRELRGVPGWEDRDYPPAAMFTDYIAKTKLDKLNVALPHRDMTVQCSRRSRTLTALPTEYETKGAPPPRFTLLHFVAVGQVLLEIDDWTEAEHSVWREHGIPMLTELLDHIPPTAWDEQDERKGA